jgi:hypothetical protein
MMSNISTNDQSEQVVNMSLLVIVLHVKFCWPLIFIYTFFPSRMVLQKLGLVLLNIFPVMVFIAVK